MRVGVLGLQGQREVFIPAPSLYSEQQTREEAKLHGEIHNLFISLLFLPLLVTK